MPIGITELNFSSGDKMKNIQTKLLLMVSVIGFKAYASVTDIDGNVYGTVQIGNQLWMTENLKVTHYNNGEEIPNLNEANDWMNTISGAYSNYENDDSSPETYGRLYNWYAVGDARGICPEDWHFPTNSDFTVLVDFLDGESSESTAGGKMKETDLDHWSPPNAGATNESGFTGLPAGRRDETNGSYADMYINGYFWSISVVGTEASFWSLSHENANVSQFTLSKKCGMSIRCLWSGVLGCTDSNYQEYNSEATEDDGSCITLMGCMDTNYYEYNNLAVVDNGTCNSKIGDANNDDFVNLDDLFLVLENWLQVSDENGDVNGDGFVNLSDLFEVLEYWLQ